MSASSETDISVAFEKPAITHSDINANINISHFKPKILEAVDHLKGISHKRPDVYSTFDFITRTTASNITKETLAGIITDLVKQNIIINKKSVNGCDSFRRNTLEVFSTTDETSDTVTLITLSCKTKKATKTIMNLIVLSSSQHIHLLKPTSIDFALANS